MPDALTLADLASQLRLLAPPLKGILVVVDGPTKTLLDVRVDTYDSLIAMLDGWGILEKREIAITRRNKPDEKTTDYGNVDTFDTAPLVGGQRR